MFTEEQIRDEYQKILSGKLHRIDSKVYQAWTDLASDWLANDYRNYIIVSFVGWNDRDVDCIIEDFEINGLVKKR